MSPIDINKHLEIMATLRARWSELHSIAERYCSRRPAKFRAPGRINAIATTFLMASGDFLKRNDQDELVEREQDARVLKAAAQVLKQSGGAIFLFKLLMSSDLGEGFLEGFDDANSVDYKRMDETSELITVSSDVESVTFSIKQDDYNARNRLSDQAIWALNMVAQEMEKSVKARRNIRSNITFFYCLGARVKDEDSDAPLPSATEAYDGYRILVDAIRAVDPDRFENIKKIDYDPRLEGSEIRRLMKAGAAAARRTVCRLGAPTAGGNGFQSGPRYGAHGR